MSQDCAASSRGLVLRRSSDNSVRNRYCTAFQTSKPALLLSMTSPVVADDHTNVSPEPQINECLQAPPAPKKKSSMRRMYERCFKCFYLHLSFTLYSQQPRRSQEVGILIPSIFSVRNDTRCLSMPWNTKKSIWYARAHPGANAHETLF
eukprot:765800-Hanusia_phi.AAC.5